MGVLRKFGLWASLILFFLLLILAAIDIGFMRTAAQPQVIKRQLAASGAYKTIVPDALQKAGTVNTAYGPISASDPAVKAAANKALSPQYIQQNTEIAIDSIYAWLEGKTAQPTFKVDLSGAKTLFANNIADSLQSRLNNLPGCSAAQDLAFLEGKQFDISQADCRPAAISPAAVAEQVKTSILDDTTFLGRTSFGAADIKNGEQPLFSGTLKQAPRWYQAAQKFPAILLALVFITGVAAFLLSIEKNAAIRRIAIALVLAGAIVLIFAWLSNRAVSKDVIPQIKTGNPFLQQDLRKAAADIFHKIDRAYWIFGVGYILAGALALGVTYAARRLPAASAEAEVAGNK